jgi:uncharacterized repeat protein (TIGR03803 family)
MQRKLVSAAAALLLPIICPAAALKVLHAFRGSPDGSAPESNLIFDAEGNLYGTTYAGGNGSACVAGCGTVFQLTPDGSGGFAERVIHSFQGPLIDGQNPQAPLIFDALGNLYGATYSGGQSVRRASGTVFKLAPNPDGSWTETVLHSFNGALDGGHDGGDLQGGLVFDQAGNLYGTTAGGGTGTGCGAGPASGCGTVFELSPTPVGDWQETILHNFTNDRSDGWNPESGLIFDAAGSLYGTTFYGGSAPMGGGTVFKLTPASGGWQESVLHSFTCAADGCSPYSGLVFDTGGNLYGTTVGGGDTEGDGTAFKLSPSAAGLWTETVIHTFTRGQDGIQPYGGPILDAAGNVYGTTLNGGGGTFTGCADGCGTVYELIPAAGGYTETILVRFGNGGRGIGPLAGLGRDAQGNLYGAAAFGGPDGAGVVFEVVP